MTRDVPACFEVRNERHAAAAFLRWRNSFATDIRATLSLTLDVRNQLPTNALRYDAESLLAKQPWSAKQIMCREQWG